MQEKILTDALESISRLMGDSKASLALAVAIADRALEEWQEERDAELEEMFAAYQKDGLEDFPP